MSEYFEIAYALASNKLCLFTGTGFSKAVTGNTAPSWQGLLETLCLATKDPATLKDALFPPDGKNPLNLDEAAQVISLELSRHEKRIHEEIARIINEVKLDINSIESISNFLANNSLKVVTTNYDKLLEQLAGENDCISITPGLPVPRANERVKVYHVHGSIDSPDNMVVTSEDYFRFLNKESYFSKKLSTILHENTVVILGYSLGDTNLKAIISDYQRFSKEIGIGSSLFFVSRDKIKQQIKDYYSHCYGIRVMDNTDINEFFRRLSYSNAEAAKNIKTFKIDLLNVLYNNYTFNNDFIMLENSFYEIILSLAAIGKKIEDPHVVKLLGTILSQKKILTNTYNAWSQYTHLANWLIYLGSILELKNSSIGTVYLEAVLKSMTTMREEKITGHSWQAYRLWDYRWYSLISSNRTFIKEFIEQNTVWPDALYIVRRG